MSFETDEQKEDYIRALLEEREGYERSGNKDGVKGVDAELKRLGNKAAAPAQRSQKR